MTIMRAPQFSADRAFAMRVMRTSHLHVRNRIDLTMPKRWGVYIEVTGRRDREEHSAFSLLGNANLDRQYCNFITGG